MSFDAVHEELVMRLLAIPNVAAGNAERDAKIDDTRSASIRAPSFSLSKVDDVSSMSIKQQFVRVGVGIPEINGFIVGFGKRRQTAVRP